ncbi:MAG: BA14K family protein [Methyloceanibacter sp.]
MTNATLKAVAAAALIGLGTLTLPAPAEAGRGYGHGHGHGGWGGGWGAGLVGFGVGAIVGSALAPREVYVAPPPPPGPAYYGPAAYTYAPPAWTPDWYTYCAQRYRSFNPRTGYFVGYDGLPYFCQ